MNKVVKFIAVAAVIYTSICCTQALAQCPERQTFTGAEGQFGNSVSVSGDTAMMTAKVVNCADACAVVYVYQLNGATWNEKQQLTVSYAAIFSDSSVVPVSLSGDIAIVGAYIDTCNTGNCGSATVFRFNGISWEQEQKLTASDGESGDHFGASVSVSGNTIVVGAPWDKCAGGFLCGSVYVYRYNGVSWLQEQRLTVSDIEFKRIVWRVRVCGRR